MDNWQTLPYVKKIVHGLSCSYLEFWDMLVSFLFMPKLCSGGFNNYICKIYIDSNLIF